MDAKVLTKYIKIKATEEVKGTPKSKIHIFSYRKYYLSIHVILMGVGSLDISSRDVCLLHNRTGWLSACGAQSANKYI